mmetsp:Transcript_88787/g.236330  ORF Transcript_88787/g.236330 Transcript_88787/m.236330 type:complete len:219 (+) Transcript_88787:1665-2321(+)
MAAINCPTSLTRMCTSSPARPTNLVNSARKVLTRLSGSAAATMGSTMPARLTMRSSSLSTVADAMMTELTSTPSRLFALRLYMMRASSALAMSRTVRTSSLGCDGTVAMRWIFSCASAAAALTLRAASLGSGTSVRMMPAKGTCLRSPRGRMPLAVVTMRSTREESVSPGMSADATLVAHTMGRLSAAATLVSMLVGQSVGTCRASEPPTSTNSCPRL